MVRTYKRKSNRGQTPADIIMQAVDEVTAKSRSVRSVAAQYELCHVTLSRYVKKQTEDRSNGNTMSVGYIPNRQVFNSHQEQELRYLLNAASIYYGLSPKETRKLAYECALKYKIRIPESWTSNESAGEDWFSSFLKRHPTLSIRVPEATSLSRMTSFNRENVKLFFAKLAEVMDRHNFHANDIWNVDETGVTTVQKPRNIVAAKGSKQVGAVTSAERGALVTVCAAVNAVGNYTPPMMVFPRVNFKDHFIRDGPPGCVGAANSSGWMTTEHFMEFMRHFVSIVKPSNEKPVLLLLDNHESHLGIQMINYAKENGVIMLSFPPHCSHKLQPLDRSVFGPLKKLVATYQDSWMRNNPGKTMTIYDVPTIIKDAWPRAAIPTNITRGFEVSGICPFNPDIFTCADYAPSSVTDRPIPEDMNSTATASDEIGSTQADAVPANPSQSTHTPPAEKECRHIADEWELIDNYAKQSGRQLVLVDGDGHCLLHAIRSSIEAENVEVVSHDDMCDQLTNEIKQNLDFYQRFAREDINLLAELQSYVHEKKYNTDTADLVIAAICNTFGLTASIYQCRDGTVTELDVKPSRTGVVSIGNIYLALCGAGLAAHYNVIVSMLSETSIRANVPPPLSTTDAENTASSATAAQSNEFSPEHVRPFPKARPRKATNKGRKKRKTTILTDTPEKLLLEKEQSTKTTTKHAKQPRARKQIIKPKPTKPCSKKRKPKERLKECSSDEEDVFCLVCVEPYSNSKPGEEWIQCVVCNRWSHKACAPEQLRYICQNCDSDDSDFAR